MGSLKTYYTGLISWDWSLYPSAPYKGKGWIINFEKSPVISRSGLVNYGNKTKKQKEVIINACNYSSAQNALEMINSVYMLISAEPSFAEVEFVIPKDKEELIKLFPYELSRPHRCTMGTSHFPLACMIAAKASFKRSHKYALAKFRFASKLHSIFRVDIDPSHATEHLGISPFIEIHIRFAYSIVAAYSAIEEIGLEIRASVNSPSMIDGKWNPKVKNDIEERLRRVGIDSNEKFPWDLRGKPTRIEKSKQLPSRGRCDWAGGPYVRDCELEMIDAIRIASFLRSKISSHKMNPLVTSLTSYDVENVRMLARRLLLGALGFWPPPWYERNKKR